MMTILILDDEPTLLEVLCKSLYRPHIRVIGCQEIEAAECLINFYRPDIFITDLAVSELGGLEGLRLIRHVKTHYPEIFTIILSAHVNENVRQMGINVGAGAVFKKSLKLAPLIKMIEERAGHFQTSQPLAANPAPVQTPSLDSLLIPEKIYSVLQPIVEMGRGSSCKLFGFESLVRGPANSPLQNPEILFQYAAKKEKLFELDILCMRSAFKEAKNLAQKGKIFINVQPRSLTHRKFVSLFSEMLSDSSFSNENVVLELTEQHTILNPQAFSESLVELRQQGLKIALDDYGEGYANLHLIQKLHPEYIKMSGSFSQDIHQDLTKQTIVRSTVLMAEGLKTPVIMEHIETREEMVTLCELGVKFGQGYYFARPGRAEQIERWQSEPRLETLN